MSSMAVMPTTHDFSTPLLRVFVEVARLGSFTAAGASLGYTQSAISRQVSALEEEAGSVLFDRLPRGVQPTEAGRRLLVHASAVLERIATAQQELRQLRELDIGRLRVAAFATAEAALVPQTIAAFRRAHPGVSVTLEEGLTPALVGMLTDGSVDLAVLSTAFGEVPEGVELHKLADDFMLVALPAGHRLAGRRRLRLAELADEDWIAASTRPEETLISSCLRTGFQPRVGFVARDWMAKLGLVAAGLGITLVPTLAADAVRADVAVVPLDRRDLPVREVHAALARGLTPSPAAHAFLKLLKERSAALTAAAGPGGGHGG
ncbi:LysR family transcriptional regulator [Kitasatospora acidiphila]|uniref:LysR family transcriptional regulator n=2 Tax=Kitasatospora acidiphila TaxID=2567942 RepID=A0A540W1M1_9ACTN|nr:LysR family transcriptional regulator [Kitasatospora acidiphila]